MYLKVRDVLRERRERGFDRAKGWRLCRVRMETQRGPPEQMTLGQRLKGGLGGRRRSVPERGDGQCKGPDAGGAGRDVGTVSRCVRSQAREHERGR